MGRNIPSISMRIEERLKEWERLAEGLPAHEREAFRKMVPVIKDRRTAIDAADEDLSVAMLLAMVIRLKRELDEGKGGPGGGKRSDGEGPIGAP